MLDRLNMHIQTTEKKRWGGRSVHLRRCLVYCPHFSSDVRYEAVGPHDFCDPLDRHMVCREATPIFCSPRGKVKVPKS